MGAAWSLLEPEEMRLASRDVCDDETWANTVLNRSSCSVQERLHMLAWELPNALEVAACTLTTRRKLEFAPKDMVRIFEKDVLECDGWMFADDDESSDDSDDEFDHRIRLLDW